MSEIYNKNWNRERVRAGMRWFGPEDTVTIQNIRQTPGVTNIITALHHVPAGEVWTETEIARRKIEVEFLPCAEAPDELEGMERLNWYSANGKSSGLVWDIAESLVFTEDIKNGSPNRDKHIRNYSESLRNLGRFGVQNVVGNFMLVADWTRTGVAILPDGSRSLKYIHAAIAACNGDPALREEAIKAAGDAEAEYIHRKIAFIKVPFVYGEQGVHAELD